MKKRNRRRIEVFLFVLGLLICAFTLAYFISRDEVTNQLSGFTADITLLEPSWDSTGSVKAQDAEPGMQIEKDPYVKNNSTGSVYVRMKIEVKVWDDTTNEYVKITDVDTTTGALDDTYAAVLQALEYENTAATATTAATYTSLLATGSSTGTYTSANPAYYLGADGWFYYATADTGGVVTCTSLAAGGSTPELFDVIALPNTKTAYNNGVFNKDFRIDVTAQAIPADESLTFQEIQEAFGKLSQ